MVICARISGSRLLPGMAFILAVKPFISSIAIFNADFASVFDTVIPCITQRNDSALFKTENPFCASKDSFFFDNSLPYTLPHIFYLHYARLPVLYHKGYLISMEYRKINCIKGRSLKPLENQVFKLGTGNWNLLCGESTCKLFREYKEEVIAPHDARYRESRVPLLESVPAVCEQRLWRVRSEGMP